MLMPNDANPCALPRTGESKTNAMQCNVKNQKKKPLQNAMSGIARKAQMQCRMPPKTLNGKSVVDVVKRKDSRSLFKPHREKRRTPS